MNRILSSTQLNFFSWRLNLEMTLVLEHGPRLVPTWLHPVLTALRINADHLNNC